MHPLQLDDLRNTLIRQEETIIFSLIERSQFALNPPIYEAGAVPLSGFTGCFSDFMLWQTERVHAAVRRYTSPDEHPFCDDLPEPILPPLEFPETIRPNTININGRIKQVYLDEILPLICDPGDDQHYGSSATCDVTCLQSLSKRIHYGKFIAEAKLQRDGKRLQALIDSGDKDGVRQALTDRAVEEILLKRVTRKASAYGRDTDDPEAADSVCKIPPAVIAEIYQKWIIPMTVDVEVDYLLPPE